MKKLIIAFAAVAMTIAANATTFSWGLSSGSFDTTKFANATAYLFYNTGTTLDLHSTAGWDSKKSFSYADIKSSTATELTSADISNGLFDGATAASTYGSLVPSDLGLSGNKSVKFYMAVISDDGKNVALATTVKSAMIASSTTAQSAKWMVTGVTTYTASSIPEPTSGLLLLLGVAGLALKRKRA